jgi:hypothetical protein
METVSSYYYSSVVERMNELDYTLASNLGKPFINKIHLFISTKDYEKFLNSSYVNHPNYNKIVFKILESQPTYKELFLYCSSFEQTIFCICNSDIEFFINEENYKLIHNLNNDKLTYFLTRHEHDGSCYLINDFGGSHDAFIFNSTILKNSIEGKDLNYINYIQNTSGIEALLTIFFTENLGYKLLNPCHQIKLIHHHRSNVRLWAANGKPPVGYTWPTPLAGSSGIYNKYMTRPVILPL